MKQLAFVFSLDLLLTLAVPARTQAQSVEFGPRATISTGDISDNAGGDVNRVGISAGLLYGF